MGLSRRFANTRRLRALFFALTAAVGVLSLLPQTAPPGGGGIDLALHTVTYGGLMVLYALAFRRLWPGAAGLFVYSSLIEVLQTLVPGRQGALDDVVANAAGISAVVVIGLLLRLRRA